MTITREDLDAILSGLRELKDAVAQNTADLKIQFARIAQIQADVDSLRIGSAKRSLRRKSAPLAPAVAAGTPIERRSRPR
jgi:hypothetical protein